MTLNNFINKKVPRYYSTMYQDGYEPYEILYAAHQALYEDLTADDDEEVEITIK